MRQISKKLAILCVSMIFATSFYTTSYASYIIDATQKKHEGPCEKMIDDLGVTGDSYGGFLIDAITEIYDLDLSNYCKAGGTIKQNKDNIIECIYDKYKYIVISIGVNDHCSQTPIGEFLDLINMFAELAKKLDKYVIFHTYMTYPAEAFYTVSYTCEDYDNVLRLVASINPHAKYIDMHDINGEEYFQEDRIHYNKNYYKILISRILSTLDKIKSER